MVSDEFNNIFWGSQRLHAVFFVDGESKTPLLDKYTEVEQEAYVEEGQGESVMRFFTSADAARTHLATIALKPEYIKYLKIFSMTQEMALNIIKQMDERHRDMGNFLRVDVLDVDKDGERREILFSRLISKN